MKNSDQKDKHVELSEKVCKADTLNRAAVCLEMHNGV